MSRRKGTPKTGGRKAGTLNKATASLQDLARVYTPQCVAVLAGIMNDPASPQAARVSAARELLDRGYGKPPQAHTGEDGKGPVSVKVIHEYL